MARRTAFALALGLALPTTMPPSPAGATVLVARTLDELAREADAVVVATPSEARRAFWRGGRIYTDVPVAVSLVVAGHATAGETLTVRLPGGTVGEVSQALAGGAVLEPGVPAVLFLAAPRGGVRAVVSLAAGVLPVDALPGGAVVVRPARTEGITFVGPGAPSVATASRSSGGSPGTPSTTTPPTAPRVAVGPEGLALELFVARLRGARR